MIIGFNIVLSSARKERTTLKRDLCPVVLRGMVFTPNAFSVLTDGMSNQTRVDHIASVHKFFAAFLPAAEH